MTWALVMTFMVWTGNGMYEAKKMELAYGSEQACDKAKSEAMSKVDYQQGLIARCVKRG